MDSLYGPLDCSVMFLPGTGGGDRAACLHGCCSFMPTGSGAGSNWFLKPVHTVHPNTEKLPQTLSMEEGCSSGA